MVWQSSPDKGFGHCNEVSHSCNLIQHDNVDVRAEVFHARME